MKIAILILTLLLMFVYNGCGNPTLQSQQGPPGVQGAAGYSCQVSSVVPSADAPNGGALITCGCAQTVGGVCVGSSVLVLNGVTFQSIQFCPNVTPSYPTTFPEVGFCINNLLYAVYSANDGFLTMIPPGYYDSNAIGSSCSFTVVPNCGIVN
jgi:hypothetical protein